MDLITEFLLDRDRRVLYQEHLLKENKDKISMYTQMFDEIEQFNKDWDSAIKENEKFDRIAQEKIVSKELEKQKDEDNLQILKKSL